MQSVSRVSELSMGMACSDGSFEYQFLIDNILVFYAYIIGNTDNICDTGILSLF